MRESRTNSQIIWTIATF